MDVASPLLDPRYPGCNPIPDECLSAMKVTYIPLTSTTEPVNIPYRIESELNDAGTAEYKYSSALVYGPQDPVDSYDEPGDVWINTGPEKRVWIVSAERQCVRWPGNEAEVQHPWFTDLFFYYGGITCWNWWGKSANLRRTRTRQRRGSADFGKWMKARGKMVGDRVSLGSDSDAVENWLEKLEKKEKAAMKGTKRKRNEKSLKVSGEVSVAPSQQNRIEGSTACSGGSNSESSKRARLHVPPSVEEDPPSLPSDYPDSVRPHPAGDIPPSSVLREYQPLPSDCCLGDREGREWPVRSPTLTWPNGIETILPYVKSEHTAVNLDAEAVKNMARSPFVPIREGETDSPIVVIRTSGRERSREIAGLTSNGKTDSEEERRVLNAIEQAVGMGKCVLIDGWKPDGPRLEFDQAGLESLRGTLDAKVQWQCARLRDMSRPANVVSLSDLDKESSPAPDEEEDADGDCAEEPPSIHRETTLRAFLRMANEPAECGNILDVPDLNAEVPWFIRRLSDDMAAWQMTSSVGFSEKAQKEQASYFEERMAKGKKKKRPAKGKNVTELDDGNSGPFATFLNTMGPDAAAGAKMGEYADAKGPQTASLDTFKVHGWTLVTKGGYYTFPHYDANGYCTWVSMRSGAKLWTIRPLRPEQLQDSDPEDIVAIYKKMRSGDTAIIGYKHSQGFSVLLHEGLTFIMPAGMIHEVYTPVNSVAIGGHFLTYSSIHLTQWCRYIDRAMSSNLTNAEHVTIGRSVSRMVIALRKSRRRLLTRTFLALADMVLSPNDFRSGFYRDEPYAIFAWEDLEEWKEARRIVQVVLDANDLSSSDVRRLSLKAGVKWQECNSQDYVDLSCIHSD